MKNTAKLLICGDIIPTPNNEQELIDLKLDEIFTDTFDVFKSADFRFCNMEGALTEGGVAINKAGPNIRANPKTAAAYKALGIDLVSLSNNHSLDWGKEGLSDTFEALRGVGVAFTGAGFDLTAARKPYRTAVCGHKISFITVAEHEFTIARDDRAGANPFDPFDTIEDIETEKAAGYTVIVIYHGGKEHYPYTSPNTRRRCRKMAERGADFIFCQHTHCICCYEEYAGCHICYGQGNTLFGENSPECWLSELLPMITIDESSKKSVEYIPVSQFDGRISLAKGETADAVMKGFMQRSAEILDDKIVAEKWEEFYTSDGVARLRRMGLIDAENNETINRILVSISNNINAEIHYESVTSAIEYLRHKQHGNLLIDGQE